jgi:hypothetical protein
MNRIVTKQDLKGLSNHYLWLKQKRPVNRDGSPDRRYKVNQSLEVREWLFWQKYGHLVVAGLMGLIAGTVLTVSLWRASHTPVTSPEAPQQNLDVGTVKGVGKSLVDVVEASEPSEDYYKQEPLRYIRYRGQQLGYDDYTISKFIRIARAESGLNPMVKNKSSSATGIYQFISSTFHRYCQGKNVYDFVDNIDCFYRVLEVDGYPKGLNHWNASRAKWEVGR